MNTILLAGYPKSGNTLIGESLKFAGGIEKSPHDIYQIKKNKLIPSPNPIFKSEICCIKTHDAWRPYSDIHSSFPGKVLKVITITRNPFDTLLSGINFFRVAYKTNACSMPALHVRSLNNLMPGFEIKEDFLSVFNLEKLRDAGMLDIALKNFGESGTVFLNFYVMSGTWSDFSASYDQCGIDVFKISYEELESISNQSILDATPNSTRLFQLSSFLEVDAAVLRQGFALQKSKVVSRRQTQSKDGANFFNKSKSGYWRDYFSPKACKDFLSLHYPALVRNGYESIVSEFA